MLEIVAWERMGLEKISTVIIGNHMRGTIAAGYYSNYLFWRILEVSVLSGCERKSGGSSSKGRQQ